MPSRQNISFFIICFIYLFCNSIGLPYGLLYTTLLSPLLFVTLLLKRKRGFQVFLFILITYTVLHLISGVDKYFYFKSLFLFTGVITVGFALYYKLPEISKIRQLIKIMIVINFIFTILSIALINTYFSRNLWTGNDNISENVTMVRLYMLSYEPSHYSTLIAPLVMFSIINFYKFCNRTNFLILLMVLTPLFLSFSFSIISLVIISLATIVLIDTVIIKKKYWIFIFIVIFTLIITAFFENNFLIRTSNFISGNDSSGNSRTVDALAYALIIFEKINSIWGAGFGQLKILGGQMIGTSTDAVFRLPNAMTETLVTLGISGVVLKIFIEIKLFFKFKVYMNPFNLSMFIIAFGLQLTGSFMTNTAEYVIWVLAFSPLFPEFIFIKQERKSRISVASCY